MKQKARKNLISKIKEEKKKTDLSLLNDITNCIFNNKEEEKMNKDEKNTKSNDLSTKANKKPKQKNKKKIKYDSIVFRMIQSRNNKKWKLNIVFCVSEFLTFEENLYIRLVCHLFNNGIIMRYHFLKENILFSMDKKIHEKIRKEYEINNKKKNITLFNELVNENDKSDNNKKEKRNSDIFGKRENGNFSKKQMLINMINNKNFVSIKYRVKNGEFFVPHNLFV
jgi:hypothetical protein